MSGTALTEPQRRQLRRLADVSVSRAVEPDTAFAWGTLGTGAVLPDELLSVAGLGLPIDADQRARLSRLEVTAMLEAGIRFEAALNGILSLWIARSPSLDDPRFEYMLHEVAEETRHQRAFLRLVDELGAPSRNPLDRGLPARVRDRILRIAQREQAFFAVMLLAGEEVPDHLQLLASEHTGTDPLLRAINRYHRAEEARHLSFARLLLRDAYPIATRRERVRIRRFAPIAITRLFESMVHPGVYRAIGLPGWKTWRSAHRSAQRRALRYDATRPILREVIDVGAVDSGSVPRAWRRLCGVDRFGLPVREPVNR
jgi:P-aminobenzoate N-oxygenase AurF